jgi:hypothetical protein
MTERKIDTVIDRAVRDLMDVDTDAAFRVRVTARLRRPARRMFAGRLLAAALTAAAVIAVLAWIRPSAPRAPAPTPAAAEGGTRKTAPLQAASPGPNRAAVPANLQRGAWKMPRLAGATIPPGRVVATVADAPANGIEPLEAIDAIEVDALSQSPIAPSDIVVSALSPISEMQISPLEPRPARD